MTDAHWVYLTRHSVVHVRHEVSVALLLKVEVVHINAMRGQVGVELGLLWELTLVDFLGPKGVLPQMLPVNALHWVFFEESRQQIVENRGETLHLGCLGFAYLLYQILQACRVKGRLSCCQLVQYASKSPNIRVKAVNTIVLEQFWSHIVRCSTLGLLALRISLNQVHYLLGQSEVTQLEVAVLIKQDI